MTEYQALCKCHHEPVKDVLNGSTSGKKYYCRVSGKQLFSFIYKEINMPKKKDNPETEEILSQFPDEEEEKINVIEEPFFPEEEEIELPEDEAEGKKKPEQPFLFEGDKVYNVLHTALTDVNEELKKVDKQIDNKKLEKSLLIDKKEELQEAIKIYEE